MGKVCDHTSVGMIIKRGEDMLLIERKNLPLDLLLQQGMWTIRVLSKTQLRKKSRKK